MKKVIRFISKFEKSEGEFLAILNFKHEPSLDFLQKIFNETGPMYEEYRITKDIAEMIAPYLDEKLEINTYDYFLSCEEDIL